MQTKVQGGMADTLVMGAAGLALVGPVVLPILLPLFLLSVAESGCGSARAVAPKQPGMFDECRNWREVVQMFFMAGVMALLCVAVIIVAGWLLGELGWLVYSLSR